MAQNSGYVTVDGEFDTLEERSFFTIDDFEIKDKTIILRIDINSSINPENGEILDDTRIRRHAATVKELADQAGINKFMTDLIQVIQVLTLHTVMV